MVCPRNMCMATLHKEDNDVIIIIITIIIIIMTSRNYKKTHWIQHANFRKC